MAHERAGIDLCVVSNTIHYLRDKTAEESLAFLRRWNEYGTEIQQKYKKRIVVVTSTLPCGGTPFLKELERAIVEYGLKGVLINSSHQGAYPDDDEAQPFFELVTSLGIPVMMHAPSVGFGEERMREYRLASSVGRPFDECLAISLYDLVRGVFEKFPKLKFVGCHLGGGICEATPHGLRLRAWRQGIGVWDRTSRCLLPSIPAIIYARSIWTPLPITRLR